VTSGEHHKDQVGAQPISTALAAWWRSIDRVALAAMVGLLGAGLLCSLAASPVATARIGIDQPFYFLGRHAVFAAISLVVLLSVSMLDTTRARRICVIALAGAFVLLTLTLIIGTEVNYATRWLRVGGFSLQASEFAKPAFVVTVAWLLAEGRRTNAFAGAILAACVLFGALAALLLAQPDFGQTVLLAGAFTGLVFLVGAPWKWLAAIGAAGAALAFGAFAMLPHVAARVNAFFSPEEGYQTGMALNAIRHGGLFGVGPGEGLVKRSLPDAHTDFVFAVAAEEFGLVFSLILIALLATVVVRIFARASVSHDETPRLAAAGLALLIGGQALINIAVNLSLIPPKGMTLPFVSYGGSSLLALGLTGGLALVFTRRDPASVSTGATSATSATLSARSPRAPHAARRA